MLILHIEFMFNILLLICYKEMCVIMMLDWCHQIQLYIHAHTYICIYIYIYMYVHVYIIFLVFMFNY